MAYIRGTMEEITVRAGVPEDLPEALALVKELALFEKEPDAVKVSLEEMSEAGFGKKKVFDFFVAEMSQRIVGLALYYYKYSTWKGRCIYLDDLIVTEAHRGKGIGRQLLSAVLQKGREEGVRRVEWQVLDWNQDAIEFYRKHGVEFDAGWVNCHFYFKSEDRA